MKTNKKFASIVLWTARIWGSVSLLFLFFMVGAHLIEAIAGSGATNGFNATSEMLSFLFFPVSTMTGLSLAWKWEGLGGLVALLSMIGLVIVRPDLLGHLALIGPVVLMAILFLACWYLEGKNTYWVTKNN